MDTLLVGNMDSDKTLELVYPATALDTFETVIMKPDGTIVGQFPSQRLSRTLLGNLSSDNPGLEILTSGADKPPTTSYRLSHTYVGYTGAGKPLPNWPEIQVPADGDNGFPLLADLDGSGIDEILLPNSPPMKVDGTELFGQMGFFSSLAVGDMDGDSKPDILSPAGPPTAFEAVHADGTVFAKFAPLDPAYYGGMPLGDFLLGDIDGDGKAETFTLRAELNHSLTPPMHFEIWSADGKLKGKIDLTSGVPDESISVGIPALGDLDCDNLPEIVFQNHNNLFVWKADGTLLPGWPQPLVSGARSSPLIGDIDGDGYADIVTVDNHSVLKAFDRHGKPLTGFPKQFDAGIDAMPAMADLYGDGRNEIVVISHDPQGPPFNDANGQPQSRLWVYDLKGEGPYGPVQWGQFRGGPGHQGLYKPQPQPCRP